MKTLKIVNGKMNTLQFAELTRTLLGDVHKKTKKLLNDLGFNLDDANLHHEEFQIVRDDRGYISRIELDRDLSLTLAGQYEPKIAYHVAKSFNANTHDVELSPNNVLLAKMDEGLDQLAQDTLSAMRSNLERKMQMEREAIENRKYVLIDGMEVAVMNASKVDLPHSTMTELLTKHGVGGRAWMFNYKLQQMGLVVLNPNKGSKYIISEKGMEFGKNVVHGNTYFPRFFDEEFLRLLDLIEKFDDEMDDSLS